MGSPSPAQTVPEVWQARLAQQASPTPPHATHKLPLQAVPLPRHSSFAQQGSPALPHAAQALFAQVVPPAVQVARPPPLLLVQHA